MSEEKRKNTSPSQNQKTAYILIGIGVIFLLVNVLNINFAGLWPLILIALGVYLLWGRNSIGSEVQTGTFRAPLEGANTADVNLYLSVGEAEVNSLAPAADLLDAELTYVGDIDFDVSGSDHKTVTLRQTEGVFMNWLNPATWFNSGDRLHWQVRLNPQPTMNLHIQGGVGKSKLDLSPLHLSALRLHGGAGEMRATLPSAETAYPVEISGGVGEVEISFPSPTSANLEIKGGVGEIRINTAAGTAIRVDAHGGIGDVALPKGLTRIKGGDSEFEINKTGVWESEGYAEAEHQLSIHYAGGVGTLKVR